MERTILYINNEHCFSLEQLKQYFSNDIEYGDRIFFDLIDSAPKDIPNWLREHDEHEMAEKIERIDKNTGSSNYLSQLCLAITSNESCSQYLKSIKPDFLSCFELKEIKTENNKDCTKINIQLKVSRRVKENYELKITTGWGTRAFFINPWDYEEDEFVTKDFVLIKRQNIEIGEICLFADNQLIKKVNHKNNVSKEISSSSDTQNEGSIPLLPIELVDEEVIKFWIHSFSKQKLWFPNTNCSCIDLTALEAFVKKEYRLNCDIANFKGSITRLIHEISIQTPFGIKQKMLENNSSFIIKDDIESFLLDILNECKHTGATIGKHRPLKNVHVDRFLQVIKEDFGIDISKEEIEKNAYSQHSLFSFLKLKIDYKESSDIPEDAVLLENLKFIAARATKEISEKLSEHSKSHFVSYWQKNI